MSEEYEDSWLHDRAYVDRTEYERLQQSHAKLLAAAKQMVATSFKGGSPMYAWEELQAAIAAAEAAP